MRGVSLIFIVIIVTLSCSTKNKYIIDDFEKFITEFNLILNEKIKSLERLIIRSYVHMAIKAVANEFLTIGFLNNELKIKKQHLTMERSVPAIR